MQPDKAAKMLKKALTGYKATGLKPMARPLQKTVNEAVIHQMPLAERFELLNRILVTTATKNQYLMTFFVFYDIENDKIRTHISNYLQRMGCIRIQKSVFLVKTHRSKYDEIGAALKEIQAAYENTDSVMLVPIPENEVSNMKVIGAELDIDFILQESGTLWV
jgi:CRISPR-associated protein Cas2